jgi:hypothetical protein
MLLSPRALPGGPELESTMAQTLKDDPQPNYLRISLEGEWDNGAVGETSDRILELCQKNRARRVLFDVRGLRGNPSILERFNMATQFSMRYLKARMADRIPPCRFAVVGNHPLVHSRRFEETVGVNNGLPVRTFTDLKQALAWLEAGESEKAG